MTDVSQILNRVSRLKSDRGSWETHWEEIAEVVLPRYKDSFVGQAFINTKGDKRTQKMFDATAALGLERFASVMESMLVPRNRKWHRLQASDEALNRDRETRIWFDEVTNILFKNRYTPKANYASQQHESFMGLGAFGTGVMFIDQNPLGGIRYKANHLGGIFFAENHQGIVDTVYREFHLTARQITQKFDNERIPESIMKIAEKTPEQTFEVIHCVRPNEEMDNNRSDFRGMAFSSLYVTREGNSVLEEGGYETFPYVVSRYVTAPGEIYGRSPAMTALPSIKTLNEQKKTVLKQGHRVVDPVLLMHDDGIANTFSMRPGAANAGGVSAEGRALVQTMPTGNLSAGFEMMNQEREVINDVFLVNLFQILTDSPQMTATEVLERTREKGMLLSPTMGRQETEALSPMIERELDILARQGLLPEMPRQLLEAEGEFEIQYDSPLSRATRAEEATGFFRSLEFATNYANVSGDPSVFDYFDMDAAMPEMFAINAVPERWKRADDEIESIRNNRAQAAKEQQAVDAAPAQAQLISAAK